MSKGKDDTVAPSSISLPSEVESIILSKLHTVKQLLCCRCVCKRWRDEIIDHPKFIKSHTLNLLENNKKNPSGSVILYGRRSSLSYSLNFHSNEELKKLTRFPKSSKSVALVGSCNGLLCFPGIWQ